MNIKTKIYSLRTIHSIGAIFLYYFIGLLIYSGITGTKSSMFPWAFASLGAESIAVIINKWDCPLHPLHKKLGDNKKFFGLFMPQRYTRLAMIVSIFLGAFAMLLTIAVTLLNSF